MALPLTNAATFVCQNISIDPTDSTVRIVTFLDTAATTQHETSLTFVTNTTNAALFTVGNTYKIDLHT